MSKLDFFNAVRSKIDNYEKVPKDQIIIALRYFDELCQTGEYPCSKAEFSQIRGTFLNELAKK